MDQMLSELEIHLPGFLENNERALMIPCYINLNSPKFISHEMFPGKLALTATSVQCHKPRQKQNKADFQPEITEFINNRKNPHSLQVPVLQLH